VMVRFPRDFLWFEVCTTNRVQGGHSMSNCIFVLDDHYDTTELLELTLKSEGFPVKASTDPHDVLTELKGLPHRPCIIFLDHTLKGLHAAEFKNLAEKINPPLHFVLMTGYDAEQKANELGIKHFLQKPFDPDAAVELARKLYKSCCAA